MTLESAQYFTGEPCKRGHVAGRYESDRSCVECAKERARLNPPAKLRTTTATLRYRYGITLEDKAALLEAQGGRCAICECIILESRDMHVDHDHSTGAIRAVLCRGCNIGIGSMHDDLLIVEKAAAYLRAFKEN